MTEAWFPPYATHTVQHSEAYTMQERSINQSINIILLWHGRTQAHNLHR